MANVPYLAPVLGERELRRFIKDYGGYFLLNQTLSITWSRFSVAKSTALLILIEQRFSVSVWRLIMPRVFVEGPCGKLREFRS